jgi:methyltransferase (TIGR00027 family)
MTILFYMRDGEASRTAQYMAFFRALETQEPLARRLFDDPYAFALLSGSLRSFVRLARFPVLGRLVHAVLDLGWPCTRSSGVVRTRAIDDLVREALGGRARQLVLLGAGFDTRGSRLEEAKEVAVFEVDHPATQQVKQERLRACMGPPPANIRYVAVDFERDNLKSRLIEAGYDPGTPVVVVWEGVISYLTESAVWNTFALLARLLVPSSCLIFTYMHKSTLDGSHAFPGARRWRSWVSFSGEPFIFGFDPNRLAEALRPFGFVLQKDRSTKEIAQQYCTPLGRKEPGSEAYRVSIAIRAED